MLGDILNLLGFHVTAEPLPLSVSELHDRLAVHDAAVLLCTREYADSVNTVAGMKDEIVAFGKHKPDALHTLLLYEGRFADAANKVINRNFLARLCFPVIKVDAADPIVSLLRFVDVFSFLSGSQGLGILPDLINLKANENIRYRQLYQQAENDLQSELQRLSIDYRLRAYLQRCHSANPLSTRPCEPSNTKQIVQALVENSPLKTSLVLCPTSVDTALMGVALERELVQSQHRVLSINCSQYSGVAAHTCVSEELHKAGIKSHADLQAVRKSPVLLIFKNYEAIGTYDNLYVKNQLWLWPSVKLVVTCNTDTFQHRSHTSSFLPDPTAPQLQALQTTFSSPFASAETTRFFSQLQVRQSPHSATNATHSTRSAKRNAQYMELSNYLQLANKLLVESGLLASDVSHNPRVFISYTWEQQKDLLVIQQKLLRQIVADLHMLGFPTWLDVERMTGDIDQQMAGNIATSSFALVIGTPLYCTRAVQDTNVKKEYDAILAKEKDQDRPLHPIPVLFGEFGMLPTVLQGNCIELKDLSHFGDYSLFLTEQLAPRLIGPLHSPLREKFDFLLASLRVQLRLLPGKHLVVEHNQDMIQSHDMDHRLEGHIPTFGLASGNSPIEARYDLRLQLQSFLGSPTKTCVIFGDAGSGKSLFALSTFKDLLQEWHTYRKGFLIPLPDWLPIYIPLKNYSRRTNEFVWTTLSAFDLNENDIRGVQEGLGTNQKVLFILDGYDELGRGMFPNLPQMLSEWHHCKVLITSRPEHFESESQFFLSFSLRDPSVVDRSSFETHYVSPFIRGEIQKYVEYQDQSEDAYKKLLALPGLVALLSNPFLLNITLQSYQQLQSNFSNDSNNLFQTVTRTAIYQAFSKYWFGKEAFKRSIAEHDCVLFAQRLAYSFFTNKTITVSPKDGLWSKFFDEKQAALQGACPLRRNNQEYSFLHKSLFEFFVACHLWDSLISADSRRSTWNRHLLTDEKAIVNFIVDLYQQTPSASKKLLSLVYASRDDSSIATSTAAANAITVLNAARFCFSGMNLSKIRIPGADLEGALLHHTRLKFSDLRGVRLAHSFLHSTDFSGCDLTHASLGEQPMFVLRETVRSLSFSAVDETLVILCDKSFQFWSRKTYAQSYRLPLSNTLTAISPYGNSAAYFFGGNSIMVLDLNTRQHITIDVSLFGVEFTHMVFSPDGTKLACCGKNMVTVWDTKTGNHQTIYDEKSNKSRFLNQVAIANRCHTVAACDAETLSIWQLDANGQYKILLESSQQVARLLFSSEGKLVCMQENNITIWDRDFSTCQTLEEHANARSLAFSLDGRSLVLGTADKTVKIWNLERQTYQILEGHQDAVTAVAFSHDGRGVASSSADKTVKFWNLTGDLPAWQGKHETATCMTFLDGSTLATGCWDSSLNVWNLVSGKYRTLSKHADAISSAAFSRDGSKIAFGSYAKVTLYDVAKQSLQTLRSNHGNHHTATSLAFSYDGTYLAAGFSDSNVDIWNFESGDCQRLTGYYGTATSVAFSPDGLKLAVADLAVKIWDLRSGSSKRLSGHTWDVNCLAFSPDGCQLVSGSADRTMKVWNLTTYREQASYNFRDSVWSVTYSLDGGKLAAGSVDNMVTVWDLQRGTQWEFIGPKFVAYSGAPKGVQATFSPDGTQLAICFCGGLAKVLEVWKLQQPEGRWIKTFSCRKSLDATNCLLAGAVGLSSDNQQLLAQLGAKIK